MRRYLAGFLVSAAIGLAACSGPTDRLPIYSGGSPLPPSDPAFGSDVEISYLGAGGMLIKRGPDALMTAPFFSNPSVLRVAFGEIRTLPAEVDRFLRPIAGDLAQVTAVLVGHAHYDHLMDVPYAKKTYLPRARIYGSDTMKNTLAADPGIPQSDVISVEHDAGTDERAGKWWYPSPRLRIMALRSEHAPAFAGLRFFEGGYTEPLSELPSRALGWREGQTLAWLIDFLAADGRTVEFRIHYQDAASTPPLGFPPPFEAAQDQRHADVAIVCMPGFDQVRDYPEGIVGRVGPRFVVIIHWEDFFARLPDDPRELRTVPTLDAEAFLSRLKVALPPEARFMMPAPGAWMRFPR